MYATAVILWVLFLVGAVFYTRRARHPDTRPLAAYLIFITVFTVAAFVIFAGGLLLLDAAGEVELLSRPVVAVLFLMVVFVPAFLLGRWQLRKPPRRPPRRL